jgi:predicted nucleic acid-binding protein
MILVVADTGPIHYLVLIGAIDVLPRIYHRLVIPSSVFDELVHPHAPEAVRIWSAALPAWIEVREAPLMLISAPLDPGEVDAISLAKEMKAHYVLLDDRDARREAVRHGLAIAGTIGVLERAAERGLIRLSDTFPKLLATNFRVDRQLITQALSREKERDHLKSEHDAGDENVDRTF